MTALIIRVDVSGAMKLFSNLKRNIPRATLRGTKKLAVQARKDIIAAAENVGFKAFEHNTMRRTLKVIKRKRGYSVVGTGSVPLYPIFLDRMRTHKVSTVANPRIRRWAQKHGLTGFTTITVRKRRYLDQAFRATASKAQAIIGKEVRRSIRRSKR